MRQGTLLAAIVGAASSHAAAAPLPEKLLPARTREFLASANLKEALDAFEQTQFSRVLKDPLLEKFFDNLDRQAEIRKPTAFLGFDLNELSRVVGGEGAWATVEMGPRLAGHILLVDTTGKAQALAEILKDSGERWTSRGGTQREEKRGDVAITILEKPAVGSARAAFQAHCVKDNLLLVTDQVGLLHNVLDRWNGNQSPSLADQPAFKAVMAQAAPQGTEKPHVRFFIDLFGLLEVTRPAKGLKKKDTVALVKKQGFDALQGIGGFFNYHTADHDLFYRVAIHAPGPYQKGMRMVKCLPGGDLTPEPWAKAPFAVYASYSLDVSNAFDHFGSVFDMLAADGEDGTWKESLEGIKNDPDGPRIDFRKEIVSELGNRVTTFGDVVDPITRKSVRLATVMPVKNAAALEDSLRRFLQGDERVTRRLFKNHVIYEIATRQSQPRPGEQPVKLANAAIAVGNGYLFFSQHVDFVETLLGKDDRPSLALEVDYRLFRKEVERLGKGREVVAENYAHMADDLRPAYELTRKDQLEGARSLYAQIVRVFLKGMEADGIKANTQLLPEFQKISTHCGNSASFTLQTPNGWEVIGFFFRKPAP